MGDRPISVRGRHARKPLNLLPGPTEIKLEAMHDHSHHHDHGDSHSHGAPARTSLQRMSWFIAANLAFASLELAAGFWANSLALISDAGHNFADVIALFISGFALWAARRPSNSHRTFGYHRVGILAALANAVSLVVIALMVLWESIQRFSAPQMPDGRAMMIVSVAALVVNGVVAFFLHRDAKHDLNMRSAYLHMLTDALTSVGALVAGVIAFVWNTPLADPIISILIAVLMIWSSWGILFESLNVLMESVPRHLDLKVVEKAIRSVGGVLNVHDLHVWSVSSGIIASSCHIVVSEQSVRSGQQVLKAVSELLKAQFDISHTTVQIEVEGCEPNDMYCTLRVAEKFHSHSH